MSFLLFAFVLLASAIAQPAPAVAPAAETVATTQQASETTASMRTVDEIKARLAATDPFKFHSTTSCLTDINTVCESATVRCQTRYVTMDEEKVVASACDILKCQVGGLLFC